MRKRFAIVPLLALIIVCFSSCSMSIEKRRYRPGYHVDMVKRDVPKKPFSKPIDLVKKPDLKPIEIKYTDSSQIHIPALSRLNERKIPSISHDAVTRNKKLPDVIKKSKIYDGGCDIIYFKNGTILQVTNIKVVERKLYYTKCGDNTSLAVPIDISTIQSVHLANGDELVPNKTARNLVKAHGKNSPKGRVGLAILMGVLGLVSIGLSFLFFYAVVGSGSTIVLILLSYVFGYAFGVIFAVAALILIVMAFVTGFRKQ